VPAHTGHDVPVISSAVDTPLLHRRRVLRAMRTAREDAGLSQEQLAKDLEWSLSKVIRTEGGTVGISRTDLTARLFTCGITDKAVIDDLAASLKAGRQPDPCWSRFAGTVGANTIRFYAHEQIAARIRHMQLVAVPDLLQHPAYAVEACPRFFDATEQQRADHLAVLAQRQALLAPGGPPVTMILDEGVIEHAVRGPVGYEAFTAQFEHLLAVVDQPGFSLRVLPLSKLLRDEDNTCTYTLFDMPEGDEPQIYIPDFGDTFRAHPDQRYLPIFVDHFERVLGYCLDRDASRDLLVTAVARRAKRHRVDEASNMP